MVADPENRKCLSIGLGVLQLFIGLGATCGGMTLSLDPSGATLGVPIEILENSPFSNFLIPGLILFTVNGLASLLGATASFARHRCAGEIAMALGVFLVAWIIIQVYWIAGFHWLHALYFGLGLLEFALGRFQQNALRREPNQPSKK